MPSFSCRFVLPAILTAEAGNLMGSMRNAISADTQMRTTEHSISGQHLACITICRPPDTCFYWLQDCMPYPIILDENCKGTGQ